MCGWPTSERSGTRAEIVSGGRGSKSAAEMLESAAAGRTRAMPAHRGTAALRE
jgi:hypothetical protein